MKTDNPLTLGKQWHLVAGEETITALASRPEGLNDEEAAQRLSRFGPNRLPEKGKTPAWLRLLLQFHNPLIYVLLATALVTALLQEWIDSGVILGVAIINAIIGFVQEAKAEQAIESLKHMLAPSATVFRNAQKIVIPAVNLVPGDVVSLQGGDKIPADVRWLRVKNVQADEAALTGESLPVTKTDLPLEADVGVADRVNMAFSGTLMTAGSGTAMVIATGEATEIGQIAEMLQEVEPLETPLTKRLAQFSKTITVVILAAATLLVLLGYLLGKPLIEMFMAAVALAVSAIPEGLPAIMTIALAIGVKRMVSRNSIIRRLPAVETLGSTTVICTDKTGTLTRNEMTVTMLATVAGNYTVQGAGYVPVGSILDESNQPLDNGRSPVLEELARAGTLCNEACLAQKDGQWKIHGDPTEGALIVLAHKFGLDPAKEAALRPRTDVIPFESAYQFMATLHHDHSGNAYVYLKGAPEKVLSFCATEWGQDHPLDRAHWENRAKELAASGLRILAIATKKVPNHQVVLDMADVGSGLEFLGLVGIMDPPREEAAVAVNKCRSAGIRVKMITGDHVETARAIAIQLGIGSGPAVSGAELDQQDDERFKQTAATVDVFARVSPAHKLRLVQALQGHGEVVAMTGDGVNDAPALKQADVGVAMGITGTEVSKEAADMVLVDDNFSSIEQAIEEGRTVFNNLKKTILFILPTNGGECLTLVAAIGLGVVLPILPLHILWINLVTTVALAITLAFDPVETDTMQKPPRPPKVPLIDRRLVWRTVFVSVLMAAGTFGLFFYEYQHGIDLRTARTTAVNAMVFFEVFYLFNSRHLTSSVLNREGFLGNRIALWGVGAVVLFQMLFTYWPVCNTLFQSAALPWQAWSRIIIAAVVLFLTVEAGKAISRKLVANLEQGQG